MKKVILSAFLLIVSTLILNAQAPNAFKYQAIASYASGNPIANQLVSFRVNLLQGSTSGTTVYTETHAVTTNEQGLVNLEIGNGSGGNNFAGINWANSPYFIKIEMDTTGGSNFQLMGTSQLLSVPYALYAQTSSNTTIAQYSQLEIDLLVPYAGLQVFNTDYQILQYYNGIQWLGNQITGCVPMPNAPNAGIDQYDLQTTTTNLSANSPNNGINGEWSILNGSGGSFSDMTNPNSIFTGTNYTTYTLSWSLKSNCDTLSDEVIIKFGDLLSNPSSFTWQRINTSSGTGLANFGLGWFSNTATNAVISKNGASKLVQLSSASWNTILTKGELIAAINAGIDIATYENVPTSTSNPNINDVLAVSYNSNYYLILIESSTVVSGTSTTRTIFGQYKN